MRALRTQFDGTGAPRTVATPTCCCCSCCCCAATCAAAGVIGAGVVMGTRKMGRVDQPDVMFYALLTLLLPMSTLLMALFMGTAGVPSGLPSLFLVLILPVFMLLTGSWFILHLLQFRQAFAISIVGTFILVSLFFSELIMVGRSGLIDFTLRPGRNGLDDIVFYCVKAAVVGALAPIPLLIRWRRGGQSFVEKVAEGLFAPSASPGEAGEGSQPPSP